MEFDDLEMEREFIPGDTAIRGYRDAIRQGRVDDGRKEITITLQDAQGAAVVEWQFSDAWIKTYDPPTLGDRGQGDDATQSCTVKFDQMTRRELV